MKRKIGAIVLLCVIFFIISCAAGPNEMKNTPNRDTEVAGFWKGLWHGLIFPFAFIASLFLDHIGIYEIHNNGGWYNLGFLLGAMMVLGGSSGGAARKSCSSGNDRKEK